MSGFDLSHESYDMDYCEVTEDVYLIAEQHVPGGASKVFPYINNRGFIFKVKNAKGKEHLLMSGIPTDQGIPKVKKLEKETGLKLTLIVGSGDAHHMAIKQWLEGFPKVKILQSGLKFPKTRNGIEILSNPNYKKRIELVTDFELSPTLDQYKDTVQFFGFNQFQSAPDAPFTSKNLEETTKAGKFQFISNFATLKPTERILCVWAYHVPSKQLIYEHNFGFYLTKEHHKQFGFPFSLLLPKETICSVALEKLPHGPTTLEGCQEHCRQMAIILDLDVRALMEYHSLPGAMAARYKSKKEYRKELTAILVKTGEHEEDGAAMYRAMSPRPCLCC